MCMEDERIGRNLRTGVGGFVTGAGTEVNIAGLNQWRARLTIHYGGVEQVYVRPKGISSNLSGVVLNSTNPSYTFDSRIIGQVIQQPFVLQCVTAGETVIVYDSALEKE